jgi:tellurite resistance protein TerC
MCFAGIIYFWHGHDASMLFLTGYAIEKSLSVDNLFVFLMIFNHFKVPGEYQHKILFYGIVGALVMRALFIWGGISIIAKFDWVIYVFGAFLVFSGIKMLMPSGEAKDLQKSKLMRLIRKFLPVSPHLHRDKFLVKVDGKTMVTPLFVTLIFIEISDIVFAVDSIPAIIGITDDPFLVFTSNVFAILGLRALYFALKGVSEMFEYLKYGLSAILIFIGAKMLAHHVYEMPVSITMAVIFGVLGLSVGASLIYPKSKRRSNSP